MIDRYTKMLLTIIAINTTALVLYQSAEILFPKAWANQVMSVHVEGGMLDYETDVGGGPTLKICTEC